MTIPYPSLDTGHSGLSMASSYHYPSISQHKAPTSSSLPSSQPPSLGLYHQVPVPAPTPERLCLPPPSPGLYNSVSHHPAPSTSAPPTPRPRWCWRLRTGTPCSLNSPNLSGLNPPPLFPPACSKMTFKQR